MQRVEIPGNGNHTLNDAVIRAGGVRAAGDLKKAIRCRRVVAGDESLVQLSVAARPACYGEAADGVSGSRDHGATS